MSQGGRSSNQQPAQRSESGSPSGSGDVSKTKSEEWSDIKDPDERRKIQSKLAQQRRRDKIKKEVEEADREADNRRRAGNSYASPEPEDIETNHNLSGLPWGGISMKHVVETGKNKGQNC